MSAVVDEEVGMPVSEIEEAGEWSLSLKDSHESALVPLSDVHKVHNEDDDELKIDTSNSGYQPVEAVAKLEVTIEDDSAKNIKTWQEHVHTWVISYAKKFAGVEGKKAPPMTKRHEMVYSSILAFIGIFLVSLTDYWYLTPEHDVDGLGIKMLTGAYAATSGCFIAYVCTVCYIVLIYEAYQSPLAQPRNVMGSYIVASFTGVTTRIVCDGIGLDRYITGPIAVFFALLFMNMTKTIHPPGGACALIAVIGGPMIEELGYGYMVTSICAVFMMLCIAVIGNNLIPSRQYPLYWY